MQMEPLSSIALVLLLLLFFILILILISYSERTWHWENLGIATNSDSGTLRFKDAEAVKFN